MADTLRELLAENTSDDCGYDSDTLDQELCLVGYCKDGNEEAAVYWVACGGYHISCQGGEMWHDGETNELEGFREV